MSTPSSSTHITSSSPVRIATKSSLPKTSLVTIIPLVGLVSALIGATYRVMRRRGPSTKSLSHGDETEELLAVLDVDVQEGKNACFHLD